MISYRMNFEDGGHQANGKDPPRLCEESKSRTNSTEKIVDNMTKKKRSPWFAAWCRETRMFIDITAMHGVKRIWISRAWTKLFWGLTVILLFIVLTYQLTLIVMEYMAKPVVSDITFVMTDDGLEFPKITICSYNPMKKSYVDEINKTGDFSMRLARYMLISNNDVLNIFGGNDEEELEEDDVELQNYKRNHPGFSINSFYRDAGFKCDEILKLCSFAGRQFNCCEYSTPVLSELGLCQEINLQNSPYPWMKKQTEATESAGLQIILDSRLDEQYDVSLPTDKIFNVQKDNGFKFYLEESQATSSKTSKGISVSPGNLVYTSVSLTIHELLDTYNWGVCINEWPEEYSMKEREHYQATDCQSVCKAKYFNDRCSCSPFMYNIEGDYRACTPLEVYRCVREYIVVDYNQTTEDYVFPECKECATECKRAQFDTFNSYGQGFADEGIYALMRQNPQWTEEHIKENFLSINVYFRDMAYTSYIQVQDTTVTDTLSNMGGTMGLFLGMSVLTVIESIIYLGKVLWQSLCCGRRKHVAQKEYENRKEKVEIREAVNAVRTIGVDYFDAMRSNSQSRYSIGYENNRVIELRISLDDLKRQIGMQGNAKIMIPASISDPCSLFQS